MANWWNLRRKASPAARPATRNRPRVEELEARTLLNAGGIQPPAFIEGAAGTLRLPYAGPTTPAPQVTVDWGDHQTQTLPSKFTNGILSLTHTYAEEGNYQYTVVIGNGQPGGPGLAPVLRGSIHVADAALTAKGVATVNLQPGAGVSGPGASVTDANAAGGLADVKAHVTINWGDGTAPAAATDIRPDPAHKGWYLVYGSHTYAHAGAAPYTVSVQFKDKGGATATATSKFVVASPAVALAGTLTGTYTILKTLPDLGASYALSGGGALAVLGNVKATGGVQLPGFMMNGTATGSLTLTAVGGSVGSVTLQLTGVVKPGQVGMPEQFTYTVTAASGAYANLAKAHGTADLHLTRIVGTGAAGTAPTTGQPAGTFTLDLHPAAA